jgi:hypothetical protein
LGLMSGVPSVRMNISYWNNHLPDRTSVY